MHEKIRVNRNRRAALNFATIEGVFHFQIQINTNTFEKKRIITKIVFFIIKLHFVTLL